jgi:hypothetical protein
MRAKELIGRVYLHVPGLLAGDADRVRVLGRGPALNKVGRVGGNWTIDHLEVIGLHVILTGEIALGVGGVILHRAEDKGLLGGLLAAPAFLAILHDNIPPVLEGGLDVTEILLPLPEVLRDPLPLFDVAGVRMASEVLLLLTRLLLVLLVVVLLVLFIFLFPLLLALLVTVYMDAIVVGLLLVAIVIVLSRGYLL